MSQLAKQNNHKSSSLASDIESFTRLVNEGIDAWNRAGKILVVMMGQTEGVFQKIRASHPEISHEMLSVFERIGRKQIYAPLLADNSFAARRLLDMPYALQEKYATESIEVVTSVGKGGIKTVKKKLHDLSRPEVKMVFGADCIYSVQEQAFRFPEKKQISVELPTSNQFSKPTTIGYFTISVDEKGTPTIKPCEQTERAQWIRVQSNGSPHKAAVILFYRS